MLRRQKRRTVSEDYRQEDRRHQQNDADMEVEVSTKISLSRSPVQEQACMDPIVKVEEHLDSHKKKKRKLEVNPNSGNKDDGNSDGCVDTNLPSLTVRKKLKKSKSKIDPVVQRSNIAQHTKSEALYNAGVENSRRKKKKRKVDFGGKELKANDLSWKSESDSVAEKIANTSNTSDSVEMPSTSSVYDLQHLEDSIVDDYVSVNSECNKHAG